MLIAMLDQVGVSLERRWAHGALDGAIARMAVAMLLQFLLDQERLVAQIALERLNSQMPGRVQLQAVLAVKEFPAHFALQRVDSEVVVEGALQIEMLLANIAFVQLQSAVVVQRSVVQSQFFSGFEVQIADFAH